MDFSFFAHRFFVKNLWKFISQMGNPLGVHETNYKVKKVKNLLFGKIWPPSDLLFLEWSYCICYLLSVSSYLFLAMCYLTYNTFYQKLAILCKNLFFLLVIIFFFTAYQHIHPKKKVKWFLPALFFMFYVFSKFYIKRTACLLCLCNMLTFFI